MSTGVLKTVETGINIYEKRIVRQVGYLQEFAQGPVIAQAFTSQHETPQLNAESFSPTDHSAIGPSSIISYFIYIYIYIYIHTYIHTYTHTHTPIILVTITTLCSVQ